MHNLIQNFDLFLPCPWRKRPKNCLSELPFWIIWTALKSWMGAIKIEDADIKLIWQPLCKSIQILAVASIIKHQVFLGALNGVIKDSHSLAIRQLLIMGSWISSTGLMLHRRHFFLMVGNNPPRSHAFFQVNGFVLLAKKHTKLTFV